MTLLDEICKTSREVEFNPMIESRKEVRSFRVFSSSPADLSNRINLDSIYSVSERHELSSPRLVAINEKYNE